MTQDKFDQNWQIVETAFDPGQAALYETLFALGNGTLGMRGTFEEGLPSGTLEGTYINGFYETAPIIYGEKFHAFAEDKQTILNLANPKVIRLSIDGETFGLSSSKVSDYRRVLDMRAGILHRALTWETASGKLARIEIERLVHQEHPHLALIRYAVTPLNFDGPIDLYTGIDGAIRQSEHAEDDPRLGTTFSGQVLEQVAKRTSSQSALMAHRTVRTQFSAVCGIRHILDAAHTTQVSEGDESIGFAFTIEARRDQTVRLDKFIVYAAALDPDHQRLQDTVLDELDTAADQGYEALRRSHQEKMAAFWDAADITIKDHSQGDAILQRGLRFNMFHLLGSAGRDGRTSIAAKGLTGLGYEGHYFWDTEIYVLPFFLHTQPEIARKLLEYRYHILDKSRQRARQMSHKQGALYAWRTIDGAECSANFPTGTAQYHINADIAFAIWRYYDATQDQDFMKKFGAEILCETARLWLDVGVMIAGRFRINGVTGPDEYQILVNNNAYTNLMARHNLHFASQTLDWLRETDSSAYADLAERVGLREAEPGAWLQAAEAMVIPYDPDRGLIAQDDTFLSKAVWDFENTPPENYPLLLHYHPLVVMRYQVCKQADTVLAEFLLHDQFDRAQKQRDFDYYEKVTTHDSSLSTAIFGIMAAELGYQEKAASYFAETATMDLENKHNNTQSGIHAANMAGAWQGIVFGFAGMRAKDGLSFNPILPDGWGAYAFKVRYRGRTIAVRVDPAGPTFELLAGDPVEITLADKTLQLEKK